MATRLFDLNIEEVLENWEVHHGIRELISNALDEQVLSHTADPNIEKSRDGWRIRDFGRGLRIEHFTQNENPEKLSAASGVIGKFGVGLKDALATLHRHGITVTLASRFGSFRLKTSAKVGFQGIETLHIEYDDAPRAIEGTDVLLVGVRDEDVTAAKSLFLKFSPDQPVEVTQYGEVLEHAAGSARVYISGVYANEEPNFLFSYNITSLTGAMRKKLNRERLNVGRSTYTERIVAILKQANTAPVKERLADQALKTRGEQCDEMQWADISQVALNALSERNQVSFVTETQWQEHPDLVDLMRRDGYQVVVVGDAQQSRLEQQMVEGGPQVRTLGVYVAEFNQSFEYKFVEEGRLSKAERDIYRLTPKILDLVAAKSPPKVRISETLRPDLYDFNGIWDASAGYIVIKRSALASLAEYAGVLLHEVAHATTGTADVSREFETVLTRFLGSAGSRAV